MSNKRLHELYDEFEQVERTTDFEGFLVDRIEELEAKLARSDRKEIEAVYRRLGELEAKLKWLEGLLRMNQICNCCGDHLSEGACVNLDCGRYGANQ